MNQKTRPLLARLLVSPLLIAGLSMSLTGCSGPAQATNFEQRVDTSVLDGATADLSQDSDQQISDIATTTFNTWVDGGYGKAPVLTGDISDAMVAELQAIGISNPTGMMYDPVQRVAMIVTGGASRYHFWVNVKKDLMTEAPDAWSKVPAGATSALNATPSKDIQDVMNKQGYALLDCEIHMMIRTGSGKWSYIMSDEVGVGNVGREYVAVRDLGTRAPVKISTRYAGDCAATD